MPSLLLTGGRQRPPGTFDADSVGLYEQAAIVELHTESGRVQHRLGYRSRAEWVPDERAAHVFKAGSWDGDRLMLCTETEVLFVDPTTWRKVDGVSHPWLNDVHHVARLDGRLHVVSTGLDCLLVLRDDGELEALIPALDEDVWARHDPAQDYRKVASTKPHHAHPNYVFQTPEGIWLTRFEQRDAICVTDRTRRIEVGQAQVHDGIVRGGEVWFTQVDGYLIRADPATGTVLEQIDLNQIDGDGAPMGWCRGLWLDGPIAYVGFSAIRQTRIRKNLAWMSRRLRGDVTRQARPTRVAAYDLRRRTKLAEWLLTEHGLDAVFSILPALDQPSRLSQNDR